MTRELRALTSVRGIAAWLVVLFHIRLSISDLPEAVLMVLAKGYLAVDFFFLLSGFVIWLSYAERLREGGWRAVPGFLQRRIARIWPLHLVLLGFTALLALLLIATGRHADQFPLAELPLHVLLLQNWGLTGTLTWNDPSWSISCELAAYLLFPLLAFAIDWRRVPAWAVIAAIAALLLLLHLIFAAHRLDELGEEIPRLGLARCILEFASGGAVAALWMRWQNTSLAAPASAALGLAMLAAWLTGALPETLAVPPGFAALLLALALTSGRAGNPLEGASLHYLGEISYATYLAHFPLWYGFKLTLVHGDGHMGWGMAALYLALVLACSVALYHGVERPAQRRINGLLNLPSPRPTASR